MGHLCNTPYPIWGHILPNPQSPYFNTPFPSCTEVPLALKSSKEFLRFQALNKDTTEGGWGYHHAPSPAPNALSKAQSYLLFPVMPLFLTTD